MNETEAREILGSSKSASYKDLRAAYRRMILLVHPDKAEQDDLSQVRAKEASSRINEAWEYLDAREKQGVLGNLDQEASPRENQKSGRATYAHECAICGFAPATKISAPIVISFIYFVRGGKYQLSACRSCGLTMSRMALRESLIKGWWGLGIFMMPHAIFRYFMNVKALSKIDFPAFRDPSVVTPSQYPLQVPKSPFKEPIPLIASAVAIIGIVAILFGGSSNSSNYKNAMNDADICGQALQAQSDYSQEFKAATTANNGTGQIAAIGKFSNSYLELSKKSKSALSGILKSDADALANFIVANSKNDQAMALAAEKVIQQNDPIFLKICSPK